MTDETPMGEPTPDASSEAQTAPIETPASPADAPGARQGIPAWAVISGAAAAGLIVVAGVDGYAIGQANAEASTAPTRIEAGGPAQPGPGDGRGDRDGREQGRDGRDQGRDGRGFHHEWGQGHGGEPWGPQGPGERMGPRDDFDMRGPQGLMPQRITPEDLQQLLDLLMQSDGGQWGPSHGDSHGS